MTASTPSMTPVIGVMMEKAASPAIGTRMRNISSVAYAEEDITSEDRTARAVGFPSRWPWRSSLTRGGPRRTRLIR